MAACGVCSGRRRFFVTHPQQATGATIKLQPNADRVAIILSGQFAPAAVPPSSQTVAVGVDDNATGKPVINQTLSCVETMTVEVYGSLIQSSLTFVGAGDGLGFVVTEIILRPEVQPTITNPSVS